MRETIANTVAVLPTYTIIGLSGSGKSSLVNALLGCELLPTGTEANACTAPTLLRWSNLDDFAIVVQ